MKSLMQIRSGNLNLKDITLVWFMLDILYMVCLSETSSLVNICNALAFALMKPWMPTPASPTPPATPGAESPTPKGKGAKDKGGQKSKTTLSVTISSDAMPDLKKAIEVCLMLSKWLAI